MNTSSFIQLFSFLLFSSVYGSHKFSKHDLTSKMFDLRDSDAMNLQEVQTVFQNAANDFNNNFDRIDILFRCNNVEVVKYVLAKSVNMDPTKRSETIVGILSQMLLEEHYKVIPDTPAYEIILICLEELKKHDVQQAQVEIVERDLGCLICEGNVELAKKFVEAGFNLPLKAQIDIQNIAQNQVKTINYLVENGLDLSEAGWPISALISSYDLTVADFKFYLANGLPLDFEPIEYNWLELALESRRFDIAICAFEKGLRLPAIRLDIGYDFPEILENALKFVEVLARRKAFTEVIKLIFLGNIDFGSIFSYMPRELIYEMIKPISHVDTEAVQEEVFV